MTNDILLFAAAQLKKYCKSTKCKDCIFSIKNYHLDIMNCRLDNSPKYWDIEEITGENH